MIEKTVPLFSLVILGVIGAYAAFVFAGKSWKPTLARSLTLAAAGILGSFLSAQMYPQFSGLYAWINPKNPVTEALTGIAMIFFNLAGAIVFPLIIMKFQTKGGHREPHVPGNESGFQSGGGTDP